MRVLSMKVPEQLDRDLANLATRRGVSKSALVREAVAELLRREQTDRGAAPSSFLARANDLAGCVEGPGDLSTNPEHLDGYGE